MAFVKEPVCKGCKKSPEEIGEYKAYAMAEGMTPTEWVKENERSTPDGNFYCTNCYIKAGMPLW